MISCFWNYDWIVLNPWCLCYVISWTYGIMDNIICKIMYDIMLLKLWYHSSESMKSVLHDIIDIWYHICFDPWYHSQPPHPPFWSCQMANKMAIKWFQCEYTLLHRQAWQRRPVLFLTKLSKDNCVLNKSKFCLNFV